MYLVKTTNIMDITRYSEFQHLIDAKRFAACFDGVIYQQLVFKDWSRYRFQFDDENEFVREVYEEMGWSKEKIDHLEKFEGLPSFYICNLDDPSDDRTCGPDGWINSMEMCYECPSGMTKEEGRQVLLDLGMVEGIPSYEERFPKK